MHLLIASRADPPLALARLRASQRLAELRIRDLRFSPAEAEAFLVQAVAMTASDQAVALLLKRTEGWIAGLQLAALSLRTADRTAVLEHLAHGSDRYIMDYLFEQVLNRQPSMVQEFLLKTSILDQMSPALAQAVLGAGAMPAGEQVSLAALEGAGVFVSALDNRGEWYSYHALFRELLRHHLQQHCNKTEIHDLHRRASAWFRNAGLIDEALHHALASGDVDLAATLIIDHFSTWLDRENWPAIERWLSLLPAAAFAAHPWLLVASAHIAQLRSDYGAVLPLLEEAEARLVAAPHPAATPGEAVLRAYLDLLWSIQWLLSGQTPKAIASARQALHALPPTHRYVRGTALTLLTAALQVSGAATEAIQLVQNELARTPRTAADDYSHLRLLMCLMSLHLAESNLVAGAEIGAMLIEESLAFHAPITQLWAHLGLGAAAYEGNDLPRALRHFAQGAELRLVGHMRAGHECLVGLAITYQALGRNAEARGVVNTLTEYHRQSGNLVLAGEGRDLELRLDLLAGTLPAGALAGDTPPARPAVLLGWRIIPAVTRVYALLADGTLAALAEARSILDELIQLAIGLHKPARQVEFLALKALLLAQQQAHPEAMTVLKEVVAIGAPRGLIRSVIDAGAPLTPLLLALAKTSPSPYLEQLATAIQSSTANGASAPPAPAGARIRLTRREHEVLALLATYRTDREIAEQLVISPLTVRTHIEHLSEKLEVSGRRAIIARAAEMNLLA
jgi:LuxR family maltose regulon positive regulatory protein